MRETCLVLKLRVYETRFKLAYSTQSKPGHHFASGEVSDDMIYSLYMPLLMFFAFS